MARSATTPDSFNAVAEPQRGQILNLLAQGERPLNDVAPSLRLKQPQVSKHFLVLRQVGPVSVRGSGQQRLYRLNGEGLKPIHDWVKPFERFWEQRFDRLDDDLRELQTKERNHGAGDGDVSARRRPILTYALWIVQGLLALLFLYSPVESSWSCRSRS